MEYATQMDAARKGIVTKEMEIVAKKENIDVESLRQLIAKGQVIIPANKNHQALSQLKLHKYVQTCTTI